MFASQLRRRCIAFLAMLAVAFGALAPTLAQAVVAGSNHDFAMEVCTSTGMLLVQGGGGFQPSEGDDTLADMQKQCSLCSMQGSVAPPSALPQMPLLHGVQDMPIAFYRDGPRPVIWLGAHTRAPPPRG